MASFKLIPFENPDDDQRYGYLNLSTFEIDGKTFMIRLFAPKAIDLENKGYVVPSGFAFVKSQRCIDITHTEKKDITCWYPQNEDEKFCVLRREISEVKLENISYYMKNDCGVKTNIDIEQIKNFIKESVKDFSFSSQLTF